MTRRYALDICDVIVEDKHIIIEVAVGIGICCAIFFGDIILVVF
ncbi:hypothetical protein ACJDT4_09300 [Clostridium neuense]|uniref:Uncharacterized protein n=1 Tax=Clostridium neuense TaxID=1728934 RepID=A0ABW8TDM4_9CLOT